MVGFFHLYVKLIAQLKAHGDVCERSTKRIRIARTKLEDEIQEFLSKNLQNLKKRRGLKLFI